MMTSTTNEIFGHRVTRHIGVVRGITVRSRNAISDFGGQVQAMFGGKVGVYIKLAEAARKEAMDELIAHAHAEGANAIIAMRYDANDIADGITEVLAYGTAVVVEPA